MITSKLHPRQISILLRGEPDFLRAWIAGWQGARLTLCVGVILAGAGLYGAAMGSWRSPEQALYVALKLPLILLLTALGNGLLNAMLAPLLGLNLTWRQSLLAILTSFTLAAVILAAFSPLAAFLVWNAPSMTSDLRQSGLTYSFIQLTHVACIALAGIAANLRLAQLLRQASPSPVLARRVLVAWLAGNLFLGSQLSWMLRPFIGSPSLPVEFLRASPLKGNFYESVLHALLHLLQLN